MYKVYYVLYYYILDVVEVTTLLLPNNNKYMLYTQIRYIIVVEINGNYLPSPSVYDAHMCIRSKVYAERERGKLTF